MLSQQASASVGHRGHSLPMSHSFGTELPFRLRIEHSDRRLSKTLFRSTFTLNTQGMTLALNLQVCIFRRPSPSKVLVSTQYGQPQAWFALPIDGNTLVIASKDRCEEGNESFFLLHSFRARWAGQESFSIWTYWYIPLALILVLTSCQQDTWSEEVRNTRFYHPITTLLHWTQLRVCRYVCISWSQYMDKCELHPVKSAFVCISMSIFSCLLLCYYLTVHSFLCYVCSSKTLNSHPRLELLNSHIQTRVSYCRLKLCLTFQVCMTKTVLLSIC